MSNPEATKGRMLGDKYQKTLGLDTESQHDGTPVLALVHIAAKLTAARVLTVGADESDLNRGIAILSRILKDSAVDYYRNGCVDIQ